jgi:hypothetical protein
MDAPSVKLMYAAASFFLSGGWPTLPAESPRFPQLTALRPDNITAPSFAGFAKGGRGPANLAHLLHALAFRLSLVQSTKSK